MLVPCRYLEEKDVLPGHIDVYEVVACHRQKSVQVDDAKDPIPTMRVAIRGGITGIVLYEGEFAKEWEYRVMCDDRSRAGRPSMAPPGVVTAKTADV